MVTILHVPACFTKFAGALPVARVCLLLLGDRPSPAIATQILRLIEICLRTSTSFIRKFELVSGWNILKTVLPHGWSTSVQAAAIDILMAQPDANGSPSLVVVCPQILPAVFSCLQSDLLITAGSPIVEHIYRGPSSLLLIESYSYHLAFRCNRRWTMRGTSFRRND